MGNGYDVWFTEDATAFLQRAGEWLTRHPVTATVVATVARSQAGGEGRDQPLRTPYNWFAVVSGPVGEVAGAAMRTAPFPPYPPYLLAMPDAAAEALADALLDRGEEVDGGNGLRPAADAFAARLAARTGRRVEATMHTRLFELGTLVDPRPVPGRMRDVRPDEAGIALDWIHQFHRDADEQAGRPPGRGHDPDSFTLEDVERMLRERIVVFWVDESERPVHLTAANLPAFGVSRIGPVFTPKEERGRGWASAAVAEVSRRLLAQGARVSLFTDQANPTSNHIYTALGFEPVCDTVDLRLR